MCDKGQKQEVVDLFGKIKLSNSLDYVSGWYYKTGEYMQANPAIKAALVSTNSITQGEQVYPIWNTLRERFGIHIDFAWRTFFWASEASDPAHVHCVIIGFSRGEGGGVLYDPSDGSACQCDNLSPYLRDLPEVLIQSRKKPLCDVPSIVYGNKPADGGYLVLSDDERSEILSVDPAATQYIRQYVGAKDFLNGQTRWCIWLLGISPSALLKHPILKERVVKVREFRAASSAKDTQKRADTPWEFFRTPVHDVPYMAVPRTSSQRRSYLPIGYFDQRTIPSDATSVIPNASLYLYGVLQSQMHCAWMRVAAGRLKSDYRYSGDVVYNNFVWPDPTLDQRSAIESAAQAVLDARASYEGSTLADMYDPDNEWMFPDLFRAHRALDSAVEAAYGVSFGGDEERIVSHLFQLYAQRTPGE